MSDTQQVGTSGPDTDRFGIVLDAKPVPRRHWGRWVTAILALAFFAWIILILAGSQIRWEQIPAYVFSSSILDGLVGTIQLTVAVMLLAIVLGVLVAVARQSGNPVLAALAGFYVWIFRGVPTLVQLLLWFNLALIIPEIHLGPLFSGSTNTLMTPFFAALLGLGLSESAYMAEIVRGGMLSVPPGQVEAARSIGMTPGMTMRRIILPQALPVIVPPTGNEFIGMLKYTSLAFAVSYMDLLSQAQKIYTSNFAVIEVLLSATVWYLVLVSVSMFLQRQLERSLARGRRRRTRPIRKAV